MSRLEPYVFAGGTAVVTGAASGMGEQLARQLAARGSDLVLVDRHPERLAAVASTVSRSHPNVSVDHVVTDLADTARIAGLAQEIVERHPDVSLLVNNAGVALGGTFEQLTLEDFDWVLRVNLVAPVTLTHHLLPTLLAHPGSHIVNVSSLYGLIAPPGQTAYSASKFGLRGFSQSLRLEVLDRGVGVTTVHPGGIRTRIAEEARMAARMPVEQRERGQTAMRRVLTYAPEQAAADILRAVERRKARLLIGNNAKIPALAERLAPVGHTRLLAQLFGRATRS